MRRWQGLAWLSVALAIAVALVGRATSRKPTKGVLLDHLEFGRRLVHGEDVYGPWRSDPDAPIRPLHAPYPPSFGLLTAPFHAVEAAAGLRSARFAWALLQLASLAAIGLVLRALLAPRPPPGAAAPPHDPRWPWLWLATFVATGRFLLRDTHGGGGNLINVALALLALHASERGHDRRGGILLAFSLVTKPTLVWLVPVFALFGRRRLLGWTLLMALGFLALTLGLQRGDVAPWWRWLQGSWALATQADPWAMPAFDFPPFEWMNQALRFAVARWCGTVPPEFAARVAWGVPPGAGLPAEVVAWIVRAISAGLLLATLAVARRAGRHPEGRLAAVAATLVLTLLLSPISWKGHHVALVPVALLLLRRALWQRGRGSLVVLAAFVVTCVLPGGDLVGDDADEWLNSTYVVTTFDVVLLLCGLSLAVAAARSAPHEDGDAAAGGSGR